MLKKVIYDYFGCLKWGNIKKTHNNFNAWWMYFYMLTLFPILMDVEDGVGYGVYYCVVIPVLFAILTLQVVPMKLPKQMFLCPMEKKERRKYVHELFAVRLVVPFILGIAGSAVVFVIRRSHILLMGLEVLALISIMTCCSVTTWEGSIWSREENGRVKRIKDERLKGLYMINIFGMMISMIVFFVNFVIIDDTLTMGVGIYACVVSVIMIILDILVMRYYPVIVEFAVDYEKTMKLEVSQPKR